MSRYSRKAEAAGDNGDTSQEDRYLRLFQDQLNRLVAHEKSQQLPAKPATRADQFTADKTRHLTDQQLADEFNASLDDPATMDAILARMDERDREAATKEAEAATRREQRAWSQADPVDAVEQPPADPLHNPARRPARNLTKNERVREEYEVALEAKYLAAEEATNGHMLNVRGRARGIDPYTLFSGPSRRATAYGSDELLSYFREHGRMTFKAYRHAVLGWSSDSRAARNTHHEDYSHVA